MKIWDKLKGLSRLARITLVLFIAVAVNSIMDSTTGYQLYGGDVLGVLFFIAFCILILRSFRSVMRKLLWRLRNRLLVSYFLFGVVPLVLIALMVVVGLDVLFGQLAANMIREKIDKETELVYTAAHDLALSSLYGAAPADFVRDVRERIPGFQAITRTNGRATLVPEDGVIHEIPTWSKPGFKGLVKVDGHLFMVTHASAEASGRSADAIGYIPIDSARLDLYAKDFGTLGFAQGTLRSQRGGVKVSTGRVTNEPPTILSTSNASMPSAHGFWDWTIGWVSFWDVKTLDGKEGQTTLMALSSRPSVIIPRVFSSLGVGASWVGIAMLIIVSVFLFVEVVSLIISLGLTRTITRTVHDLYVGTKHVANANFSHRIPIRSKDQLSELGSSFNSMTEQMVKLIAEVKEKEKLESELEIAREVQSTLFPKGVPEMKTLELAGICNPARVVSGDYYDFIRVDPESMAIVIGDISGKGISAALLMASVQSSLHSQLTAVEGVPAPTTAVIVTRLNQQLYENTPPEKYATFYCGVYDDVSGRLAYTNAGHLPPILIRDGKASRLEVNGMVVGMMPNIAYDQLIIQLQPGDLLAAFTDGITESENQSEEQYGDERLIKLLIENSGRPLQEIVETVTTAVRNWAFDLDNQDDTTMLLARRL